MKINLVRLCLMLSVFSKVIAATSAQILPADSNPIGSASDSSAVRESKVFEKRSSVADSTITPRDSTKTSTVPAKAPAKPQHPADSLLPPHDSIIKREKTVVVQGKTGQALAQSKQQNADNLKNVIDAELIGKLPDQSTADALQRVPGISIERDNGEGHYVMIRGTESRLSTVTIDGQSIAGTDASTRAVDLNVVPSDQLAEIEVAKVLMPEMDADAIGGTVNLITSTARDSVTRIKANFIPGYMQMSDKPIGRDRFPEANDFSTMRWASSSAEAILTNNARLRGLQ